MYFVRDYAARPGRQEALQGRDIFTPRAFTLVFSYHLPSKLATEPAGRMGARALMLLTCSTPFRKGIVDVACLRPLREES